MDWDALTVAKNPLPVRVASWFATLLLGIWCGVSMFAILNSMPDLFQRLGALGVGALLMHYVFIRFTWRRRSESVSSMSSSSFTNLISAKAGHADLGKAERIFIDAKEKDAEFAAAEAKSVVIETVLLFVATIQWGFGDWIITANVGGN